MMTDNQCDIIVDAIHDAAVTIAFALLTPMYAGRTYEQCFNIASAMMKAQIATRDTKNPTPISEKRSKSVCLFEKSASTCAYLGIDSTGFCCMKNSSLHKMIANRVRPGTIHATGDNCPGPPFMEGEQ